MQHAMKKMEQRQAAAMKKQAAKYNARLQAYQGRFQQLASHVDRMAKGEGDSATAMKHLQKMVAQMSRSDEHVLGEGARLPRKRKKSKLVSTAEQASQEARTAILAENGKQKKRKPKGKPKTGKRKKAAKKPRGDKRADAKAKTKKASKESST